MFNCSTRAANHAFQLQVFLLEPTVRVLKGTVTCSTDTLSSIKNLRQEEQHICEVHSQGSLRMNHVFCVEPQWCRWCSPSHAGQSPGLWPTPGPLTCRSGLLQEPWPRRWTTERTERCHLHLRKERADESCSFPLNLSVLLWVGSRTQTVSHP